MSAADSATGRVDVAALREVRAALGLCDFYLSETIDIILSANELGDVTYERFTSLEPELKSHREATRVALDSIDRLIALPPAVPKADGGTYRDGLEAAAKVCDVHERHEWDRRSTHEDDDAQIEAHGAYVMAGRLAAAIRALPGRGE